MKIASPLGFGLILALLAGSLMTTAFAPYGYAYAIFPGLMLFYYSCRYWPQRALAMAYTLGLGLFGAGIWWIYLSVHDAGGADSLSAILITVLGVTFFALFSALTAIGMRWVVRVSAVSLRILLAATLWIAIEYWRGYGFLNGFPWLQIGYSQITTPLAGYAPLLGVYGIGFLLAVSAFSVVEIIQKQLQPAAGMMVLLIIWGGGWALQQQRWTDPAGEPISVTLIQGNIEQSVKWQPEQKLYALQLYRAMTEKHWDSNVILWPETAIPAFLSQVQTSFLQPLADDAKQHGVDLVVSLPTGTGKQYYNSVLVSHDLQTLYHKSHLLPFGEYLPLQPVSGWILDLIAIPLGSFTPGAEYQPLLKAGGYPFVTTICYEDAFGNEVIRQVKEAAYLVNLTNDAWFGDSSQPYQHLQMAQMRALETGRYMLRATNTGVTAVIAPDGSVQSQAPLFTLYTLTDTIVPMQGLTPYARWGDRAVAGLVVVLFVWILGVRSIVRRSGVKL